MTLSHSRGHTLRSLLSATPGGCEFTCGHTSREPSANPYVQCGACARAYYSTRISGVAMAIGAARRSSICVRVYGPHSFLPAVPPPPPYPAWGRAGVLDPLFCFPSYVHTGTLIMMPQCRPCTLLHSTLFSVFSSPPGPTRAFSPSRQDGADENKSFRGGRALGSVSRRACQARNNLPAAFIDE